MQIKLENFIIESDVPLTYFNEIVNYITNNEKRILSFFKLEKLPQEVKIEFLSYGPFKEFIVSKYGEILDYVSGDSDQKTNTIRILNIEDQIKYTIHKEANINQIMKTVLHEIVHQCHHVYHTDYRQTTWFAEGLATNLSNQDYEVRDLNACNFYKLKTDFRHYKRSYNFSYNIVKYVLENYPEQEIEKLYKNPDYLRKKADTIFEEAKEWLNDLNIKRKK